MNPFLCCLMTLLFVTHAYGSAQQVREEEESPLIQEKPTQLRCDEYDFTPIDGREKISFLKTLSAVCLKVTKESKAPRNLCSMEKDTLKAVMINHPCALEIAGCAYVFVNVESLFLTGIKRAQKLPEILKLFPHLEELVFAAPILSNLHQQPGDLEKYITKHVQAIEHYITSCRDPGRPLKTIAFPRSMASQACFLDAMKKEPLSHFSLKSHNRPCPTASRTYEFLYIFERHTFKTYANDTCEGCMLF